MAIVTGGASGIGSALVMDLARRGASDIVLADLQEEPANAVARDVERLGAKVHVDVLDVRDADAVERMAAHAMKRAGRLDYVFNNAGVGVFGEAHLLEATDWDLVLDVNVRGMVNVVRATYPRLLSQGFGHLVNTASLAGLMPTPFLSVYCASKHAVVGLSKTLRIEAARYGVRVSVLCPGVIRTPILRGGTYGRTVYDMSEARRLEWWERVRPRPMEVEPFAREALDAVAKNEAVIVLPRQALAILRLFRLVPALEETFLARLFQQSLRDFPEISAAAKRTTTSTGGVPGQPSPH